jgi:hypothetical protein
MGDYALLSEDVEVLVTEALAARDALRTRAAALSEALLAARPATGAALEASCSSAQRLLRELELELRRSNAAATQTAELRQARAGLETELHLSRRTLQAAGEHQDLLAAGSAEALSARDVIQQAEAAQAESLQSVRRMQKQVQATKAVGLETMANLSAQHEQIENLSKSAAAMESQLSIAQLEVQQITGHLFGDMATMVMLALIALGCVVIVVWHLSGTVGSTSRSRLAWPSAIADPLSEE